VWTIPLQPNLSHHIAPFPPDLVKKCILLSTKRGDIVLDPFIGSGTTSQVALSLKRKCIGIDINKNYLNIVKNRCLM
jgi:DNA modification methylase